MDDLDIGRSRSDGPPSMHAGALAIAGKVRGLRHRVYNLVDEKHLLTDREIIVAMRANGEDANDATIIPRRIELTDYVIPALLVNSGLTKMDPKSGVDVILWRKTTPEEQRAEMVGIDDVKVEQQRRRVLKAEQALAAARAKLESVIRSHNAHLS